MHINIHEAKTHLSRLVDRAAAGEEIVIGRAGRPLVRLVPYRPPAEPRRLGALEGKIRIAPDFDETDEETLQAFEESELFPDAR